MNEKGRERAVEVDGSHRWLVSMCAGLQGREKRGTSFSAVQEVAAIPHCRASQQGANTHSNTAQSGGSRGGVTAPWENRSVNTLKQLISQ